ncbi:MAG: hypothetical protein LQ338_006608 [Usnochroma carphineum]|nr:MAG: hypothetical protein LQ338_006608 [Usnochroma carphineum]
MPVNWKDSKAFERLLAAMVAAQDMKLDYRKIATMYGEGATYDAIEGRFRIIKRQAAKLVAEIESGARPPAPSRGASSSKNTTSSFTTASDDGGSQAMATPTKQRKPRSTNTTPRANAKKDHVASGRVSKDSPAVKKEKKGNGNVVKGIKEEVGSSEGSMYEDLCMEVVDAEGVAEGLGLGMGMDDVGLDFGGVGEMEV